MKAFTFEVLKKKQQSIQEKKTTTSPPHTQFLVQTSKKPQDFIKHGQCHNGSIRSTLQGAQLYFSSQQNTGRKPQPSDTPVLLTHSIHGCNKYWVVGLFPNKNANNPEEHWNMKQKILVDGQRWYRRLEEGHYSSLTVRCWNRVSVIFLSSFSVWYLFCYHQFFTQSISGDQTAGKRSLLLFRASPKGMYMDIDMHKPSGDLSNTTIFKRQQVSLDKWVLLLASKGVP